MKLTYVVLAFGIAAFVISLFNFVNPWITYALCLLVLVAGFIVASTILDRNTKKTTSRILEIAKQNLH
jgi:type VI protein secretion system component VasF